MRLKRENWKGKYYLVRRRKNGTIISRRKYKIVRKKKRLPAIKRLKKSVVKQTSNKKFTKKNIIEKELLSKNTGISEIQTNRSIQRKKGVMQIKFLFFKEKRETVSITSRSNKMYLTSGTARKQAFDQCYQRALAQITFSPLSYAVREIRYIYWETGV